MLLIVYHHGYAVIVLHSVRFKRINFYLYVNVIEICITGYKVGFLNESHRKLLKNLNLFCKYTIFAVSSKYCYPLKHTQINPTLLVLNCICSAIHFITIMLEL